MKNIKIYTKLNQAIATMILTAAVSTASAESIFSALAGPGEKVTLKADPPAKGGEHYLRTSTNPDGSIDRFVGKGRVILRSPKLNLEADDLIYMASLNSLVAKGNVKIDQTEVQATARELNYDIETDTITLTGAPKVTQIAEGSVSKFEGMEEFQIKTLDDGSTDIRMNGGDEIICEITSPDMPASGAGAVTPQETSDGGLSGLGGDVRISTQELNGEEPAVYVSTLKSGEMGLFRSVGSTLLNSPEMNLRSDLLVFDPTQDTVEALYNVFVKQKGVEVDCGRMLYNLDSEEIRMTIDPVVRQEKPDGISTLSGMEELIITKNEDGSSNITTTGGSPVQEWENYETVSTKKPVVAEEPIEIQLEDESAINRIRN